MAPTRLLLLVLVALQARRGSAVPVASGHSTSPLDLLWEPQGDPTDVGAGRALPASRLDPALELTWHRRGPPRAKYRAEMEKSSPRSSEVLEGVLKELDKATHEMDQETVENEVFQGGRSQAVRVSDAKTGAIQSTGLPVLSKPGKAHRARIYEFFRSSPGVGGKTNANAAGRGNFMEYCVEGAVAVLGSMLLGMLFCCVFQLWRKRKRRLSAASGA